ncbi:IQ domain-containing protein M isoform X3 [Bos taurus]|uniref:IQ domain-containing protein M isoform X3 n=1 Tax=Bos taurus TaxID=9913 RepID=UPI000D537C3C|nr:IQ domain-containing protein M isoform X3 [Bos taurus]
MAAEAASDKAGSSILEIPKQDFFQEAKTLIAQHYKKINENKVPGTSINVFRNKHQKPKSTKFIPLEIKKKETLDAVQELQAAYKRICFPKDRSKSGPSEEPPQRTAFSEPHIFNIKKKHKEPIDLIVKEQVKLDKIVTNIESVSKKMEKEKQLHHGKTRKLDSFSAFPVFNLGLHFRPTTSSSMGQLKEHDRTLYDWRGSVSKRFSRLTHDSSWPSFSGSSLAFQDYSSALYHGPDLRTVINMYCRQIHRVKYRLGLWRTRQIINLTELEEWMDRKKFYETMFAKREDWQGLEKSELLKYFNDCGHFPTHQQIDEVWDLVHREDREKYSDIIKKHNAIEMLFTLYPPQGAHVSTNLRLRSTWLRPIVNGEEGYKYIVSGHPVLKRANIRIVGKLVAASIRERKMRQRYSS